MFKRLRAWQLRKAIGLRTDKGTTPGAAVRSDDRLSDEARVALDALIAELDLIQLSSDG